MNNDCKCNKPNTVGANNLRGCRLLAPKCCKDGVFFNTIVIPRSMGGSSEGEPFAPKNGMYYNALVRYEADDTKFIYDSEGNYTDVSAVSPEEIEEMVNKDVNKKIAQISADGTLETLVDGYVAPDLTALDSKISNEVLARANADNALSTRIDNEALARSNADSSLQSQISGLASGSPLVVSSVDEMTDTTKIYVNTTDGKWYYYNTGTSAWTAGGTYQSTGLANGSVKVSSLNSDLKDSIFVKSADVTKLQRLMNGGYASTSAKNLSSPILLLAGTTITFSSDFVANYHWSLIRITNGTAGTDVVAENTNTSYQLTADEYCMIAWRPIDNNWDTETYTVDRLHKLDNNDITSIEFYYPKFNPNTAGMFNTKYIEASFMLRNFDSSGYMICAGYAKARVGNTIAFTAPSKTIVTLTNSNYNIAIVKVSEPGEGDTGTYHVVNDSGWLPAGSYTIDSGTKFVISLRTTDNADLSYIYKDLIDSLYISCYPTFAYVDNIVNQIPDILPDYDKYVKGINHRGYNSIAPENTIPAFKLSAENGFKYVESDVQFTSDSVPVMIHDLTIDRTSNGTGNVADMTYSQISQYDFGSWKDASYAGTKIPTLDEFLKCCKDCGLSPYIELKTPMTESQYQLIANAVKKFGMVDKTTYISFVASYLAGIHAKAPNARLGLIRNTDISDTNIEDIENLHDDNEIFIDLWTSNISTDNVNKCINNNIPLEVWTPNTDEAILALPDYVTGVTSDIKIAGKVYFDEALSD